MAAPAAGADPGALPSECVPVLIVGAGPAGLAVGGSLRLLGLSATLIDEAEQVGASWRAHYRRLHLHTVKTHSALPGLAFAAEAPRYVPRQGVVDYLEAYARHHGLRLHGGQRVVRIQAGPAHSAARWRVLSEQGAALCARHLVLATGANREPRWPFLPGRESFRGQVLHSHGYRDAAPFVGQKVLVVGMGNTGAEIALDLAEQGVSVALSVRSPVNIVRRDVLGRPTQLSSLALARLPEALGDALATLLRRLTVGDLSRWGLHTPAASPLHQLRHEGKTPVIDVGTLARIRSGEIAVYTGIDRLVREGVRFNDGRTRAFDSIVLATGYQPLLQALFPDLPLPLDSRGLPTVLHGTGELQGLHFVGYDIRQPGGLLRTIAQQAERVAQRIAAEGAAP